MLKKARSLPSSLTFGLCFAALLLVYFFFRKSLSEPFLHIPTKASGLYDVPGGHEFLPCFGPRGLLLSESIGDSLVVDNSENCKL